jgi:hypothetical protein
MAQPHSKSGARKAFSHEELMSFFAGCTGFPCANFSVAGEVSPEGELFKRILFNPPVLGQWLEPWGEGELAVHCGKRRWTANECRGRRVRRAWPFAELTWADEELPVRLSATAWAPVVAGDVAAMSLPVLAASFRVDLPQHEPVVLELSVRPTGAVQGTLHLLQEAGRRFGYCEDFGIGWDGLADGDEVQIVVEGDGRVCSRLAFAGTGARNVTFYLLVWDARGRTAAEIASLPELFRHVSDRGRDLRRATMDFPAHLPSTGDAQIDEYIRWYMVPAMILTRVLGDGTTLTMGYAELNQRDSFWTTWAHLYYWPDAERLMIEESARAVTPDGRIPACILPTIDRQEGLDTNEYFLLRVGRYARVRGDLALVRRIWSQCVAAMEYLISRCEDGSHLPAARSYWADWLDVPFMQERKYGPHFCLLYLAALREMALVARSIGQEAQARRWEGLYEAAHAQVNRPTDRGGLWNGQYYVNIWKDGRDDQTLLEDQMIAGVWRVIPPERVDSIRFALAERNERPWGVRCLYPYYPDMGYSEGDYANGAVMPWINFADACARGTYGHREDCLRLLRNVGQWDLARFGDYLPHENLDGQSGRNTHFPIQGWNAACLGAVMWGLAGGPPEIEEQPPCAARNARSVPADMESTSASSQD